jgi:hypothetical protein
MTTTIAAPPQGNDDIFQLRLDSARSSLSNLQTVQSIIQVRADEVRALRSRLSDDGNELVKTLDLLKADMNRLHSLASESPPRSLALHHVIQDAEAVINQLNVQIETVRELATKIFCLRLDPTTLEQSQRDFGSKVREGTEDINKLKLEVFKGGEKPWATLRQLGGVWIEYLDYLVGLCLRYEGLDSAVCAIGDALIDELKQSIAGLAALAVPGRESGVSLCPNLVFLRFPEWTIWALPLASHDLWHIATNQLAYQYRFQYFVAGRLDPTTLQLREEDALVEECLADTFAVYNMGPAYACAALLLALDPLSAPDRQRAQVILAALASTSAMDTTNPYEQIHTDLSRLWKRALTHAGQNEGALQPQLASWTEALLEFFSTQQPWLEKRNPRFPSETWTSVRRDWVDALLEGKVVSDTRARSLRLALNAAWHARLERPNRDFSLIASTCAALCAAIMRAREDGTVPPIAPARDLRPPQGRI